MEFLKNVHVRKEEDGRIDQPGTPHSFINEVVLNSTLLYCCLIIGKANGDDFGSIQKFATKNWGTSSSWRNSIKPKSKNSVCIKRIFDIRNKLIAHIDLDLEHLVTYDDILVLIDLFDNYIDPVVQKIFEEFLGNNQESSLDFEDLGIQTYRLLYPLHPEIPR